MERPVTPRLVRRIDDDTSEITYEIDESPTWIPGKVSREEFDELSDIWSRRDQAEVFLWDSGKPKFGDHPGHSPETVRARRQNQREQRSINFFSENRRKYGRGPFGLEEYEKAAYKAGVDPWACEDMRIERAGYFVASPRKRKTGRKRPNEMSVVSWKEALEERPDSFVKDFLSRHAPGLPWDSRRSPRTLALLLVSLWEQEWEPKELDDPKMVAKEYQSKLRQLADADLKWRATRPPEN